MDICISVHFLFFFSPFTSLLPRPLSIDLHKDRKGRGKKK